MEEEKKRWFIDMDGTAFVFKPVDKLETLYEKGYFRNLEPNWKVIEAIKIIIRDYPEIEPFILSSYLTESQYALSEKNESLDQYLPEIDSNHRIFVPCGMDKKDFVPNGIKSNDYLFDDYTNNLTLWEPPARGIKLLNGINHTHGTWQYDRIRYDKKPEDIAKSIASIILDNEHVYDDKPNNTSRSVNELELSEHDEQHNKQPLDVAIESTDDFADTNFHAELINVYKKNADGSHGEVQEKYRLVTLDDSGHLIPYPDTNTTFVDKSLIRNYISSNGLNEINYDTMIHRSHDIQLATKQAELNLSNSHDNPHGEDNKRNSLVINAFGGAGAGKTNACFDIVSELKKRGYVAEYVPEYATELVWDGNLAMLDGSYENQLAILKEQKHRLDRLIGKVDFVVTDSPLLLNSIYKKDLTPQYENMVRDEFGKYNNFIFVVERDDSKFTQAGRIHTLAQSKEKDKEITDMLTKYGLYFGTYNHSTINKVVNNSITTLKRINSTVKENDNTIQDSITSHESPTLIDNNREITHGEERTIDNMEQNNNSGYGYVEELKSTVLSKMAALDYANGVNRVAEQSAMFNLATTSLDLNTVHALVDNYLSEWDKASMADNVEEKVAVLQLRHGESTLNRNFLSMEALQRLYGESPDPKNYELVHIGNNVPPARVEDLYVKYNTALMQPSNYYGHTLSMSDILIVADSRNQMTAYYVDDIGFKKVDNFVNQQLLSKIAMGMDVRKEYNLLNDVYQFGLNRLDSYVMPPEQIERYNDLQFMYVDIFELADKRAVLEDTDKLIAIYDYESQEQVASSIKDNPLTYLDNYLHSVSINRDVFSNTSAHDLSSIVNDKYNAAVSYMNEHGNEFTVEHLNALYEGDRAFLNNGVVDIFNPQFVDSHDLSQRFEGFDASTGESVTFRFEDIESVKRNNIEIERAEHANNAVLPTHIVIDRHSDEIKIDGHTGTWYTIGAETIEDKELFLLESEQYGDEAASIIVDKDGNILLDDVYNGFDDYKEYLDNQKGIDAALDELSGFTHGEDSKGQAELRTFLTHLRNDVYSGNQDYFIFQTDNKDYFCITDACTQFGHVATGTLSIDGLVGDNSGVLVSIDKNAQHYRNNTPYDPINDLCDKVKDMSYIGHVQDERVLIGSTGNRHKPFCEWLYAANKLGLFKDKEIINSERDQLLQQTNNGNEHHVLFLDEILRDAISSDIDDYGCPVFNSVDATVIARQPDNLKPFFTAYGDYLHSSGTVSLQDYYNNTYNPLNANDKSTFNSNLFNLAVQLDRFVYSFDINEYTADIGNLSDDRHNAVMDIYNSLITNDFKAQYEWATTTLHDVGLTDSERFTLDSIINHMNALSPSQEHTVATDANHTTHGEEVNSNINTAVPFDYLVLQKGDTRYVYSYNDSTHEYNVEWLRNLNHIGDEAHQGRMTVEKAVQDVADMKAKGFCEFRNAKEVSWYATVSNNTPYNEIWEVKDGVFIPIDSHSAGVELSKPIQEAAIKPPEKVNTVSKEQTNNFTAPTQQKDAKDVLTEQLKQGIQSVMDSEHFYNWCKTAGHLYYRNYSFRNAFLIYFKNPQSSYDMGYETWKTFGRQVKQGAKSIKIFAPVFAKEYGAKGSFLAGIKRNLKEQFAKDPSLQYATYHLGKSKLGFNMLKNGLFEITMNGKTVQGSLTEDKLRKYIDTAILGKVPIYFNAASVFDIADTEVPEFIYLKSGFKKDELALNENGEPIKNRKGEYKVINTAERQARFVPQLDMTIREGDTAKMEILLNALMEISSQKGVPMTIEHIEDDGTLGYFSHDDNRIVISDTIPLTKQVAVAFHEMAHSDMHKDIAKLAKEIGVDKIDRSMKEVQAEAVACMTASNFGIDTNVSSFNYLAGWSKGRDLKELETSLDAIYKESKALLKTIEKELDSKGYSLSLEPKVTEPMSKEEKLKMVTEYKGFVINETPKNDNLLAEIKADIKDLMQLDNGKEPGSRELAIAKEQGVICKNIQTKIANIDILTDHLNKSELSSEQCVIRAKLRSEFEQINGYRSQLDALSEERIEAVKNDRKEGKANIKQQYKHEPLAVINALQSQCPQMKDLTQSDLKYIATSSFISSQYSKYLGVNNDNFVANALNQLEQTNAVKSKDGTFVEVSFCEQWEDKPIFVNGTVAHPKQANSIVQQAEMQIRGFRKDASLKGDFYPSSKCNITVYSPTDKGLSAFKTQLDIGDGYQIDLNDHLKQACSRGKEKEMIRDNFAAALNERISKHKEQLLPPQKEIQTPPNKKVEEIAAETQALSEWQKQVKNYRHEPLSEEHSQDKSNEKEEHAGNTSQRAERGE